ncbi:MAG: GldG family protein [Myxococcaceae bacterium]
MRTFGKVLGGLGLLLLLTSPITYALTSTSAWYAGVKALCGLAMIAAYVATNYRQLMGADAKPSGAAVAGAGPAPMSQGARASFFLLSSAIIGLLAIAAAASVNYIAAKRDKTWDLTNKKIYTLAPQTLSTLAALKEPVTALGFLPANHPYRESLEAIFKRYSSVSEKFLWEIKDPRRSPDLAAKYQLKEGQATVVLTRGEGEKATHTVLNVVSEQDLTNALIKINTVGEQKVYYLAGHGEWPLEEVAPSGADEASVTSAAEFKSSLLQEGYAPQVLNLVEAQNEIPRDASLVVIAGSRGAFTDGEKAAVKKYLDQGGRLLYFARAGAEPGLDKLLAEYGIQVDPGLLADDKINPLNPYMIVSAFYGDHEITRILKELKLNVEFPTPRGLSVLHEGLLPGVTPTPLVLTSPYAWEESNPTEEPKLSDGEKTGQIPLVIAATRNTAAAEGKRFDEARVVVFGGAEVLVDALWGHEPNRNLVLNSLAWASTQVSKITIRPPDRDISTIDIDEAMLSKIRFIAMDLLPLSLVGIGLAIWLARRNQ